MQRFPETRICESKELSFGTEKIGGRSRGKEGPSEDRENERVERASVRYMTNRAAREGKEQGQQQGEGKKKREQFGVSGRGYSRETERGRDRERQTEGETERDREVGRVQTSISMVVDDFDTRNRPDVEMSRSTSILTIF